MLNQTLNNRYHITALLGEGAMGEVYRATDTQTGQEVAVKVITQKPAFNEEMLVRFRREGEALRQLRHSNIVAFVDMFQVGKQQAIVMEYVPGGSLHSLIQRSPLPVDQAVRIALELSDALARAHHINIIHRDIKPENVLMAEDGAPKLTDFGVARLLSETHRLTGTGTQMGTPYYMSPEAWEGKPLHEQADIWSLGVVLFEMVTGKVPFTGETLVAVMNKVLTTPPPDLKTLRPDLSPALVKIIQRMLTRDKTKRYQFMREVALDLERVARGGGTGEKAGGTTVKEPKAKTRVALPAWAMVALVVVGLLAISGLGAWAIIGKYFAGAAAPTAMQSTTQPAPTATANMAASSTPSITALVATLTVNKQSVFHSDLEGDAGNDFRVTGGRVRILSDETGNKVLQFGPAPDTWSSADLVPIPMNFTIEFRFRMVDCNTSGGQNCQLYFYYRSKYVNGLIVGYRLLVQPQYQQAKLELWHPDHTTDLGFNFLALEQDKWRTVIVDVQGDNSSIYIDGYDDGVEKFDGQTPEKAAGGLTFSTFTSKNSIIQVDDLTLWTSQSPVVAAATATP